MLRRFISAAVPRLITKYSRPLYLHESLLSLSEDPNDKSKILGKVNNLSEMHINFEENIDFKNRLFEHLKNTHLNSSYLKSMASVYPDGWMHIVDGRALTVFGRCPDPDDIFASVIVNDGQMIPDTIERMPTHRLLTVNGLFVLPAEINKGFP
jgi:hypothetical protein